MVPFCIYFYSDQYISIIVVAGGHLCIVFTMQHSRNRKQAGRRQGAGRAKAMLSKGGEYFNSHN